MSRVVTVVNTHDLRQLEAHFRLPPRDREAAILTYPGDPHQDETADDPRLFPDARFSVREGLVAPRAYHPADDHPIDWPFNSFPDPSWVGLSPNQHRINA